MTICYPFLTETLREQTYLYTLTHHSQRAKRPATANTTQHSQLSTHNSALTTQHLLNAALPLTALTRR
ncbi:hypothetical protein [Nostoc sp. UHCC 0870]|uniref:hypothetical protein n=1 Tax=Nostoc sp. UHCC 0870 TaxID=2914041 RepID=UPI0030D8F71E